MHKLLSFSAIFLYLCLAAGCGGKSNSGSSNIDQNQPAQNFTISVSPSSLSLGRGSGASVTVSVQPQNGFSGTVSIAVSGTSSGMTISPSAPSASPSSPATLTLTASANAQIAHDTLKLQATSGSLQANASVSVSVDGAPLPDRFRLTGGSLQHGFYDSQRHLLYATNPRLNSVDVISGRDLTVQARVTVPQAWGLDQMADGKTLVIGTAAQQIATLDQDTLAVTFHPVPNGSSIFALLYPNVVALANGKVLMIGQQQGIESEDIEEGGQYLLEWDSNTGTFAQLEPLNQLGFEVDSLARSADHKWAVFSADQFYLYSSDRDSMTTVGLNVVNPPNNLYNVRRYALNADGSKIAVASANQLTVVDRGFDVLGIVQIPTAFQTSRTRMQFTADGTKLIMQYSLPTALEMIDVGTYTVLGYYAGDVQPNDNVDPLLDVDYASGRAFVSSSGGVLTLDLAAPLIVNPPSGPLVPAGCVSLMSSGAALNTSTQVQLNSSSVTTSFFVGGQPAPLESAGNAITVPASSTAGAVNIECESPDGNRGVRAVAFSYGVTPLLPSANLLPPSGGAMDIFGFGLWSNEADTPTITIGGQPTSKAGYMGNLQYGVLQGATFKVPAGAPGQTADLAVSGSYGQGTLSAAVEYLPSVKIVPTSNVLQTTFDGKRNLLYVLKSQEIDVLDPSSLTWKAPILLPQSGGMANYSIMGLSPDGSRIVAVSPNYYIAVIDPDNPGAPSLVTFSPTALSSPISLAITKYNKAVVPGFKNVELDLSTLTIRTFQTMMGQVIRASADGSIIYGGDLEVSSGQIFATDPATYTVTMPPPFGRQYWSDFAISPTGTLAMVESGIMATGNDIGFFDGGLRMINFNQYPLLSDDGFGGVAGPLFSPGGAVLAAGLSDSIEFWDTKTGLLRARLLAPETLQWTYPLSNSAPLMATDLSGQTLFVASASGITVFTLPKPMDQLDSYPWNNALGSQRSLGTGAGGHVLRSRRLNHR